MERLLTKRGITYRQPNLSALTGFAVAATVKSRNPRKLRAAAALRATLPTILQTAHMMSRLLRRVELQYMFGRLADLNPFIID
jgi:hypothetical protein